MAKIQIYGDSNKGCIFFDGSTVEPKFLGTIISTVKADETDRVVIQRTDRTERDGVTFRKLFRRLKATRVQNEAGENLVADLGYSAAEVAEYINQQASNYSAGGAVRPALDEHPNFVLDATSTTIMVDNGENFGVNTLKAVLGPDGLVDILSADHSGNAIVHYEDCPHENLQINGDFISGGPNDVVNALNELFTVGAFESVVISDPYATMVADVGGVLASGNSVGDNAINPVGDDILASSASHYNKCGWLSSDTIDQAGEYFTFDIRVTDSMGFGLVQVDGDVEFGADSYGDPNRFCDGIANSAHWGYLQSHWFHSGNKGPWTYYGQNTSSSIRSGWYNFGASDERADYILDAPIKMKVGLDANGYIEVSYWDVSESAWQQIQRSSFVAQEGREFKLGVKIYGTRGRLHTQPKIHLLEPAAPTMYFRYIESPDGVFHYPLFSTAEEAEYYDEIHNSLTAGTGSSHTHTYADDPTNTTWYMPEASHDPTSYQYSSAPSSETFSGNPASYTEITSLENSDLTPPVFSATAVTQEEGTAVNIQVAPAGSTWSTGVDISPSGSGLIYDGYSLVQGTLADIGADTTYTITVTRANSYGSSVGSMTVTATDVAPVTSHQTPWTKALDFSGSSERAQQVSNNVQFVPMAMGGAASTIGSSNAAGMTANGSGSRPWATSIVFKADLNNSTQHIWNIGEGASGGNDNIFLRLSSAGDLYFGWGRVSASHNECKIATNISPSTWYGVYVAHTGERLSGSNATAANLATCFDIRVMSDADWVTPGANKALTTSNWTSVGSRMDRAVASSYVTIGGRGANRSFHGKVSAFVTTTLLANSAMPVDAEIAMMIADPNKWLDDYKVGNQYRMPNGGSATSGTFAKNTGNGGYATQVWLMGDGILDSFSNMIRNDVRPGDQNFTKLNLLSMVSNDIQTVNITGLTS